MFERLDREIRNRSALYGVKEPFKSLAKVRTSTGCRLCNFLAGEVREMTHENGRLDATMEVDRINPAAAHIHFSHLIEDESGGEMEVWVGAFLDVTSQAGKLNFEVLQI